MTQVKRIASRGIDWHVEQSGAGPDIVLIPSGEGDCGVFDAVVRDLAGDFRVTTFDTPGFSRSTVSTGPDISVLKLGAQIADLLRTLGIEQAVFFGCSSGGLAGLDLAIDHADVVRHMVVHEVALPDPNGRDGPLHQMMTLPDAELAQRCAGFFANFFNEDQDAWAALGEAYHRRLAVNYPVWIHEYVGHIGEHRPIEPAALAGKPITWTIGALFPVQVFFSNVQLAHFAGIEIATLPCKHFPQVSIPTLLSAHIRKAAAA